MFNIFKKTKKQPDIIGEVIEKIMMPVAYDSELEKALNETFNPAFVGDDSPDVTDESGVLNIDILRYFARANYRLTPQIQEEFIKYWAINRACLMPVQDCLRNGYELVAEGQEQVPDTHLKAIAAFNKEFNLPKKLEDALYYSRVYGIRVCIFQFEGLTREHYENPINWETLKSHKYKGFFMLSPQYCIPVQFEMNDPMRFRQVNYWKAANQKYHHSWVRIIHHCEVPANQLPAYLGGGVSLIQECYEHVYQAIQASNESLQILFTKNLTVRKGDTAAAILNQAEFEQKMSFFARMTGQFRQLFISNDEDYQNIERSLQGVEDLFAKYYEIVAAVAKIPNNRFMMTQLTGFAASGEAEDRIYNSSNLSTLQVKVNPLIEFHNKAILVTNGLDHENITIEWNKCGALTESELADIQGKRIANDVQLVSSQIIAPDKAAERLSKDKDSGYAGIDLMQAELGGNPLEGLDFSMFANPVQTADKSTSPEQARFMAAAAHNPEFAKKVDIPQSVAKEFNQSDTKDDKSSSFLGVFDKQFHSHDDYINRPIQSGDIINLNGYSVLIENPAGSVRHWTDQNGRSGEQVLTCHYGELQGYTGADDDYIDVFIVD